MSIVPASLKGRAAEQVNQVIGFLEKRFAAAGLGLPAAFALLNGRCQYHTLTRTVSSKVTAERTVEDVLDEVNAALQNMAADILAAREAIANQGATGLELLWRFASKIALDHNMKDRQIIIRTRVAISSAEDRAYTRPLELDGARILDVPHARLYSDGEIDRIRRGAMAVGCVKERERWIKVPLTPFHIRNDHPLLLWWRRIFKK